MHLKPTTLMAKICRHIRCETMHAHAVSRARKFLRIYVERSVDYIENIVEGRDPRYLAKTYDFAVDNFQVEREDQDDL
jgi:hypothetical protein